MDQKSIAFYLQSRIELYEIQIRTNRDLFDQYMKTVNINALQREIIKFSGNQLALAEILRIALEILDIEIYQEYIRYDLACQEPLLKK